MKIARLITLMLCVALGVVFLSRACGFSRPGGPIVLTHARVVSVTGADQTTRFVTIAGGKITAVSFYSDHQTPAAGARVIDINGLFVAAVTVDRSAPALIDGIRHVWVGQIAPGYPGDVVIMRSSPARIRPGYIPDNADIAGAVVDGVYYSARDLSRSPRKR
jgi:imidazolonepropionase-like amidohydrolase